MRALGVLLLLLPWASADDGTTRLFAALQDGDRGVRYAAVVALGKARVGLDPLVAALDDPEWCVRKAAGRALVHFGDAAIPRLTEVLRTGSVDARVEAVGALRRIGKAGSAPVIGALADPDPCVVLEALDGIAMLGKDNVEGDPAPRLLALLEREDAETRLMACYALISLAGARADAARPVLTDLRAEEPEKTRRRIWAEWLLEKLDEKAPVEEEPDWEIEDLGSPARLERALAGLREAGAKMRDKENDILPFLDRDEEPEVIRAAAMAMEMIGADPRPYLLESPVTAHALPFVRPPEAEHLPLLIQALYRQLPAADLRDITLSIGRIGPAAASAAKELRVLAKRQDDCVRGAAVWALGRVGQEVPEGMADRSPVVRELAAATVRSVPRLVAILNGTHREARLLAARRLGELVRIAELKEALRDDDPLVRIAVVRALGRACPPEVGHDPVRDVRIAVASVRAVEALLDDPNWRVQLAAIRSCGREGVGVRRIARFLAHRDLALSWAAADALQAVGGAALPVAEQIGDGKEAVWHHAPRVFEALGEAGAPAVATLIPLLRHADVNVRETAARCLAAIGPPAREASPALVAALADRRLCVVSHAALALGRIGITDALLAGLRSDRARVRAYSAFAVGWALGKRRGADQVIYEPRLPVLDCGEPGPTPTVEEVAGLDELPKRERLRLCRRGLRSKDPRVAIPCAARLDYDQMNAWECERAVELLAPEGFRPGGPADFEKFRSYIASSELPACLEYLMYPRTTKPDRDDIHGDLHRSPRAENIPALCWFFRHEDAMRREELDSLRQPFWHTADYRDDVLRDYGGGTVWDVIADDRMLWEPIRWWLDDEPTPADKVGLLIEVVRENLRGEGWKRPHAWAAVKALGRATDDVSERYLRWTATSIDRERLFALAALARRGDPDAMARLGQESGEDDEALGLLLEARPALGAALLRQRLSDPADAVRCAKAVRNTLEECSYYLGAQCDPLVFLGLEPSLPLEVLDIEALESIALDVPGCRTRRIAETILGRLQRVPDAWIANWKEGRDEVPAEVAAFLHGAEPERYVARLRAWADEDESSGLALAQLAFIGDPQDRARVVDALGGEWLMDEEVSWRHPKLEAYLMEEARKAGGKEAGNLLHYQSGLLLIGSSEEEDRRLLHAAREGKGADAVRELLARRIEVFWQTYGRRKQAWMKGELERRYEARESGRQDEVLGQLASWPDPRARAEYWSILRAGRYRWLCENEEYHHTLGHDFATLPHWARDLESNCCRISPSVEGIFEGLFGIDAIYHCARSGVGEPPSERVREWFELWGGEMEWSPLVRRFVAKPE
jgi:HEAT repeat protein